MQSQPQIAFRNMEPSKEVEEWIREAATKLENFYKQIMGCRVEVGIPHRHHRGGSSYHIRIDLTVPRGEIVVKREPSLGARYRQLHEQQLNKHAEVNSVRKHLRRAINDAFKAAARRLQDYARRQRGNVKSSASLPVARVSKILPQEGYGFLTSEDGSEIYFHKNSVLDRAFARLKVGTTVQFVEEPGEKGTQASTVRLCAHQKLRQANAAPAV
jgi:cold shock CspA family protein